MMKTIKVIALSAVIAASVAPAATFAATDAEKIACLYANQQKFNQALMLVRRGVGTYAQAYAAYLAGRAACLAM